jgi:hypothetical protein
MNATVPEPVRKPSAPSVPGTARDLLVLAGAVVLLVLTFALVWRWPDPPEGWAWLYVLAGCALCPMLVLLVIRHGYLFARRQHWPGRRTSETEHVDALLIPPEVRRPESFAGVARIDAAQKTALVPVPGSQGRFRARALTTYAAPAVAVLLAALQLAVWPKGPFGAGLALGQALLIFFVFLRIIVDRRPTQEWIERRTRAELFRREQYLCVARVGPYYPPRSADVEIRIGEIGGASFERMTELLALEYEEDEDRATWLDHLSSQPASAAAFDDLPDRVTTYQYYRTGKQIAWLRSAGKDARNSARHIEWLVGIAAVCNILLAVFNFFLLLTDSAAGGVALLQTAVAVGAFLPALSGMLLALQSVFNLRFLAESYELAEKALERLRKELTELQEEAARTWAGADPTRKRQLQTRFQKLALRVEAALSEEYVRWRLVTQRDAHELV